MIRRLAFGAFVFFAHDASAHTASQVIAAAYGGAVPPACVGAHVDLANLGQCACTLQHPPIYMKGRRMMRASSTCGEALEKLVIAGSVDLAVAIAPQPVRGGDPMTIIVSITNRSNADLPVVIRELTPNLVNGLSIRDPLGNEVARGGRCGMGFSASLTNYMVVLSAKGVAEWRLPWSAATRMTDNACTPSLRPFSRGSYAISVPLDLIQFPYATAHGALVVQ